MNLLKNIKTSKMVVTLTIWVYVLWAGLFIYRSSFIAIDGGRYFSLFDDAMISMRYAWNFSHGNGLVWNPGERVEGYTNFLMTLIMSAVTFLFNEKNAVLTIQVFGILTVIAVVWQARKLYQLVAGNDSNPLLFVLFPIIILLYYPLSYWSLMGMETGLVTFFILLSLNAAIQFEEKNHVSPLIFSALFASLSYLTRPDAGMITLPIILFILSCKTSRGQRFLNAVKFGLIFLILPIAHIVFRYQYYGELLPNTYFLKLTGLLTANRLKSGLIFIYPFLTSMLPLWIFASLNTVLNFTRRKLMLFTTAVLYVFYQVWVGGDAWSYWRMVTPIVPLIIILFLNEFYTFIQVLIQSVLTPFWDNYLNRRPIWVIGIPIITKIPKKTISRILMIVSILFVFLILLVDNITGAGKAGLGNAQQIFLITAVVFVLFSWLIGASDQSYSIQTHHIFFSIAIAAVMLFANLRFIPQMIFYTTPYLTPSNRNSVNTAIAINATTNLQSSIGVFWAGTLPYYSHRYAVDFLGKSDTYIAHLPPVANTTVSTLPGHNKFDLTYSILTLQPDYVPGFVWGGHDITTEAQSLYLQAEYEGVKMHLLKNSAKINWDMVTISLD